MRKLDKPQFEKAAQKSIADEAVLLEKRILSDLAEMITEAHTRLVESGVFDKFKAHLAGRKPTESDVRHFKKLIEQAVFANDALFKKYFDVIVERDPSNRANIGFEFRVKPDLFR